MLNLNQVTLFCVETRSPELALFAINQCTQHAQFKKVILATDLKIPYDYPEHIELIQTPDIQTTKDYSHYLLSDLTPWIDGSHVLIIQWDSFIINPDCWDFEYLNYDYIGPPWPHHPETPVGNGGFSLRSKKLIEALQDERITKTHPEDQAICIDNKKILEDQFGIQFAPLQLASKFAIERGIWAQSFGFHGMFNFSKVLNDQDLNYFIQHVPQNFLGGLDTYDLINNLIENKKIEAAKRLLRLSSPKHERRYRYHRMHLKVWLKLLLSSLASPITR